MAGFDYMSCTNMLLHNLSLVGSTACVYTQSMDYWWAFGVFIMLEIGLFITTRNAMILGASSLLGSAVAYGFFPPVVQMGMYIVSVMGIAASIYLFIRGRDDN